MTFDPSGRVLGVGYQAPDDSHDAIQRYRDPTQPVIEQFEVPGGRSLGTLSGPPGSYEDVAYDASGRWLAAVRNTGDSSTVMAVGPRDSTARRSRPAPASTSASSRYGQLGRRRPRHADAHRAFTSSPDGGIRTERPIPRPDVQYTAMAVDPAGGLVAVSSLPGRRVDILDITTGESRATLNMPSPGQLEFSPDGKLFAVAGGDNLIRVYSTADVHPGARARRFPRPARTALAFSPDSSRLVSAVPGQLRSWDLSPQGPAALGNFHATGGFVGSFAVGADQSNALVTMYKDGTGTIERVDQATGNVTAGAWAICTRMLPPTRSSRPT